MNKEFFVALHQGVVCFLDVGLGTGNLDAPATHNFLLDTAPAEALGDEVDDDLVAHHQFSFGPGVALASDRHLQLDDGVNLSRTHKLERVWWNYVLLSHCYFFVAFLFDFFGVAFLVAFGSGFCETLSSGTSAITSSRTFTNSAALLASICFKSSKYG